MSLLDLEMRKESDEFIETISTIPKISACIITYNEERKIRSCLEAVKDYVDEIIVLDSYSTDNTLKICKEYTDKIFQSPFKSYSDQTNKCSDLASNDWVCNIEADEIFDKLFWEKVKEEFVKGSHLKYDSFCFPRKTFVLDDDKIKTEFDFVKEIQRLDKDKDFNFLPKSFPNFISRVHKKKLRFVGEAHPNLNTMSKRKFLPCYVYHYATTNFKIQKLKKNVKKKGISEDTKKEYKNLLKMSIKFFKDHYFYFTSMFFKLKFYKKGLKYWLFTIKWFLEFYMLTLKILLFKDPHKKIGERE